MPAAARGLKEYFDTTCVWSTCDKEHPSASLGDAEKSCVQHTPTEVAFGAATHPGASPAAFRDGGPEAGEALKDGGEVLPPGLAGVQKARDVFHEHPTGSNRINDTNEIKEESAPRSRNARTLAGDGPVLAGGSSANKVNWLEPGGVDLLDIGIPPRGGPVPLQDAHGVRVVLNLPGAFHLPGGVQPRLKPADAGKDTSIPHKSSLLHRLRYNAQKNLRAFGTGRQGFAKSVSAVISATFPLPFGDRGERRHNGAGPQPVPRRQPLAALDHADDLPGSQ
jgi:hypothetical protein